MRECESKQERERVREKERERDYKDYILLKELGRETKNSLFESIAQDYLFTAFVHIGPRDVW